MYKLAILGAGNRVRSFYTDILQHLAPKHLIQCVGIANRTQAHAHPLAKILNCTVYSDLKAVLANHPDLNAVIIAVSPSTKDQLVLDSLSHHLHVFMETPFSESLKQSQKIRKLAQKQNCIVEVAEDFAFLPESIAHSAICHSRKLGDIALIQNCYHGYYYHATSRLMTLLPFLPKLTHIKSNNTLLQNHCVYQYRKISFNNGLHYLHQYFNPKNKRTDTIRNWFICCEKGIIDNYLVTLFSGETHSIYDLTPLPDLEHLKTYPSAWSDQKKGLCLLLERFIECGLDPEKPLRFGLEKAYYANYIWILMEASARFNVFGQLKSHLYKIIRPLIP